MQEQVVIAVDLGGTQIRAARLDRNLQLLQREKTLTLAHEGLAPTVERIKALVRQVMPEDRRTVAGIGVSAPGPLNPETGVIVSPPNLPGWHNVALRDILQAEFNLPVYGGNDANVAALAEALNGAARGFRNVVYITVSTGIGGGVLIDGHMLLGTTGLAAEVGHMLMVLEDGRVSTLEREAAGPALARRARRLMEAGATSMLHDMAGGDLTRIDGSMVGGAAMAGDPLAADVMRYAGEVVGLGVVSLLHVFNPQIVVIGGGVSRAGDLLFDPVREMVQKHSLDKAYWEHLHIVPAALGDDVSIYGSAALVITRGGMERVDDVARQFAT